MCLAGRHFAGFHMDSFRHMGPSRFVVYTDLVHMFFWRVILMQMATPGALICVVTVISIVVTTWWRGWGLSLWLMFKVVNVIFLIKIRSFVRCIVFKLLCWISSIWWVELHGVHFYSISDSSIPCSESGMKIYLTYIICIIYIYLHHTWTLGRIYHDWIRYGWIMFAIL